LAIILVCNRFITRLKKYRKIHAENIVNKVKKFNINCPVSEDELKERQENYPVLTAGAFAKKYRIVWNKTLSFTLNWQVHEIQYNNNVFILRIYGDFSPEKGSDH
jgi:hypothetical protein